jgi:hypothetical protein
MSKALMNDVLLQSVGAPIMSKKDEIIGNIIEVTRNSRNHFIEYVIVECKHGQNDEPHFFAIPASTRFITISDTFTILFQFPKEDIFFAQKVQTDQWPTPNFKYGKSIFELYNYHPPGERTTRYLSRRELQMPEDRIFHHYQLQNDPRQGKGAPKRGKRA